MNHPSPFDLIQKATRNTTAADRWAALQTNTQARTAVPAAPYPSRDEFAPPASASATRAMTPPRAYSTPAPVADPQAVPHGLPQTRPPAVSQAPASHPELRDPPFPPPQARHSSLDDIAARHEQARKAAMPSVSWKKPARRAKTPAPESLARATPEKKDGDERRP